MKQIICFVILILLLHINASSQKNELDHGIWKQEVEKIIFNKITDFDQDSTLFIEVFLVFQIRQNVQPLIHAFLVSENGIIDSSLNKPARLYNTSFFTNVIMQKLNSQTDSYFVQPLLFGRTRDINERVIDPDFYIINKLPTSFLKKKNTDINTIFFSKQLNYVYTVRR